MVIYERYGASAAPVYNEKILAGLGRDLNSTGALFTEGVAQTLKALNRFKSIAQAHALKTVHIVATAAVRSASDGPEFVAAVKAQTGYDIKVLSGEDEAQAAAYGVIFGDKRASGIVADLGGASLELINIDSQSVSGGRTYQAGPFALMGEDMTVPTHGEPLRAAIKKALASVTSDFNASGKTLYLVGGAWRNLALINNKRLRYPLPILHNFSISPAAALELARWASGDAASDLLTWPGINTRRAETLPFSGLVLENLLETLSPSKIVISPTGLREGVLYQSLSPALQKRMALFDACRHLAMGNAQGLDFGTPLNHWLASAARSFPRTFGEQEENRLRMAACLMVGIGKGLHPDHRADLVFDDVLYAPLAGLTHKERAYLALMLFSSYRGGGSTPNDAAIDYHLLAREKQAARIYGTAMRLASVISSRSPALLSMFTLSLEDQVLSLDTEEGQESLLNRRGQLRLRKLADMLGVELSSNWTQAV